MTVPASGGSHRPLTTLIDDEIDHNFPTEVLPDGEHLLFGILNPDVVGCDGAQVVALSLLTGERKVLLEGGAQARYLSSGHLVYARAGALLAVGFDLERLEVIGEPTVVVDGVRHQVGA